MPSPTAGHIRRYALLCGFIACILLLTWGVWIMQNEARARIQRGALLFTGAAPLSATARGETLTLPTTTARCANCHSTAAAHPATADIQTALLNNAPAIAINTNSTDSKTAINATNTTTNSSLTLNPSLLLDDYPRRGGPASHYDESKFCTLLRTGQDSTLQALPGAMPLYQISDTECQALWLFLTQR